MTIYLYIHVRNKKLVASSRSGTTYTLPAFQRQSQINFVVQFVDDYPAGGVSTPLQIVDVTPYSMQMYVGSYETPAASQTTWTKDEVNNNFSAVLDLYTVQVEAFFPSEATASASKFLEVHLIDNSDRQIFQYPITIQNTVYIIGAPDPVEYEPPSALADNLAMLLDDTDTIDVTRTGDIFTFDLKDAGRRTVFTVASQAAMLALSTAKKGDAAIRTDVSKLFELQGTYSTLADWKEVLQNAGTVHTVASQAAMLALSAVKGDIAVRSDTNQTFQLNSSSPSTLADWKEILAKGLVHSVNGQTGTVANAVADYASQAAMLASGAAKYDIARRTDTNEAYILSATPASTLANWKLIGKLAADTSGMTTADKDRFDRMFGGGFNNTVRSVTCFGETLFFGGDFDKLGNTDAPCLAKTDLCLNPDPHFKLPGTGFASAVGRVGKTSAGKYLMSAWAGGNLTLDGDTKAVHSLNADGSVDEDWADPVGVHVICVMGEDRIAISSLTSLKVVENDGTVAFTGTIGSNIHSLATAYALGLKCFIATRRAGTYGGITNPRGIKLLNFNPTGGSVTFGEIDDDWSAGGGTGANANCNHIAVDPHGLFVIVGNSLEFGGVDKSWDGGSTTKHRGLYKIGIDGVEDSTWDTNIVTADGTAPQPLFVDTQGRAYVAGNISTIGGTSVTPFRLYRLTVNGALDREFTFNGKVHDAAWVSDDKIVVVGEFTEYGTLPVKVGRVVTLHADGSVWDECCEKETDDATLTFNEDGDSDIFIPVGKANHTVRVTATNTASPPATYTRNLNIWARTIAGHAHVRAGYRLDLRIEGMTRLTTVQLVDGESDDPISAAFTGVEAEWPVWVRLEYTGSEWVEIGFRYERDNATNEGLLADVAEDATWAVDLNLAGTQRMTTDGNVVISTLAGSRPADGSGLCKAVELVIIADGGDVEVSLAAGIEAYSTFPLTIPDGGKARIALKSEGSAETDTSVCGALMQ